MTQSQQPLHTPHDETEQLDAKSALSVAGVAFGLAAAPLVLLYLLAQAINPSTATTGENMSAAAIADRLRPVAGFELVPAVKGPQTGQQVFEGLCTSCHTAGTNGAPKIGANGDWAPRIGKGYDMLFQHAVQGFNQMPARGGNPKLSDLEIGRAIVYMTGKSGGHFPEPVDPAAKGAAADATKK
ncbi:c-type cytochrome [Hydromonas duriensis]|uniref:Cytochrome c5 n=1 Tax=Hydromonas duriensis TaxID=1527608 RepID=A0A4R6YAF1_9BURK|nr:c-type cytochrome [Hydromonas duriensis]TDR32528.1 cytochrome c5 [Hydromonas duriensis]